MLNFSSFWQDLFQRWCVSQVWTETEEVFEKLITKEHHKRLVSLNLEGYRELLSLTISVSDGNRKRRRVQVCNLCLGNKIGNLSNNIANFPVYRASVFWFGILHVHDLTIYVWNDKFFCCDIWSHNFSNFFVFGWNINTFSADENRKFFALKVTGNSTNLNRGKGRFALHKRLESDFDQHCVLWLKG